MSIVSASNQQMVCTGTVLSLMDNVGAETTRLFLGRFISMWPTRICRLETAIKDRDGTAGLDAALSLKSSACMSGALRLGAAATDLHQAFACDERSRQDALLEQIKELGRYTIRDLEQFLAEASDSPALHHA